MNRMYSVLGVKAVEEEGRIIRGIATTPTPDRVGDIVESLGVKFKNPMPLLWQHRSDKPVGTVSFDAPTKDGITFEARLANIAEPGALKDRVDEAWQSLKAGLVSAVSIGFRALEYSFMENGGIKFTETEVMELSLVTIPANADATITAIKSIDNDVLEAQGKAPSDDDRPQQVVTMKSADGKLSIDLAEGVVTVEADNISETANDPALDGKKVHVAKLDTSARDRAEPFVIGKIYREGELKN